MVSLPAAKKRIVFFERRFWEGRKVWSAGSGNIDQPTNKTSSVRVNKIGGRNLRPPIFKIYIYKIKIITIAKKELQALVAEQKILNKIYAIRGEKLMLDKDLAEMYVVETRVLNQSIKRNLNRFPKDFMFQLSEKEFKNLISQNVTSRTANFIMLKYFMIRELILLCILNIHRKQSDLYKQFQSNYDVLQRR